MLERGAGDHEGVRRVAAVDGTGADEVVASLPHGCEEPSSGEDTLDADSGLEEAKV
jgi:hypothetical protein